MFTEIVVFDPIDLAAGDVYTIVAMGTFDEGRAMRSNPLFVFLTITETAMLMSTWLPPRQIFG